MRVLPYLVAGLLGVGAAVLVACGEQRADLIPAGSAENLSSALGDVQRAVDDGDCDAAARALTRARGALVNLPESVNDRLAARLQEGIDNLEQVAPEQCAQQETQTTTVPTQTEETEPETTTTEPTEPDTTTTEPTEPDTTTDPTPTATEPTTPAEPAPPADTSGGVSPGAEGEG
jgi:outer membrane biosynthesis protein TonB